MNEFQTDKPDFSKPPLSTSRAVFNQTKLGWRHSLHNGWIHLEPNDVPEFDGWAHDAAEFLYRLGEGNSKNAIRVVAKSRSGELIKEVFIDPSDFEDAQHKLLELEPESVNLVFDPVPWKKGKRKKKTRFGWVTMSGVHPLGSFPEPVIYWSVGPNAYQALLPWHKPRDLNPSCGHSHDAVAYSPTGFSESKVDDLLVMPGSIIHAGQLPPFTSIVRYDMLSTTLGIDTTDTFLNQY